MVKVVVINAKERKVSSKCVYRLKTNSRKEKKHHQQQRQRRKKNRIKSNRIKFAHLKYSEDVWIRTKRLQQIESFHYEKELHLF